MTSQLYKGKIVGNVLASLLITLGMPGCASSVPKDNCLTSVAQAKPTVLDNPAALSSSANLAKPDVYAWNNVAIAGMGFVTGLVIHPHQPNLIYARTDVGGIYRWNVSTSSWIQLLDGERDRHSIESIALDPSNPDVVYAATGAYTGDADGAVLKSRDRGKTWTNTNLKTLEGKSLRMGGNEAWRWAGERLAVDPHNPQIIYFGSRLDGLYRSTDGAKSWQRVNDFPSKGKEGGIAFVLFDRQSISQALPGVRSAQVVKATQVIYVGVMGSGVYRSENGGKSWTLLKNGPDASQHPQQAAITTDGGLYVSFFTSQASPQGSVWKYQSGKWRQITPAAGQNYSAIAADPTQPSTVMVATYPLSPNGLYRTTDGGLNWQSVQLKVESVPWWPKWHLYTLMGGIAINPQQPNQVWLTTGFGVMRTEDITSQPSNWCTAMNNLEELVVFALKAPPVPGGPQLLSGVADMDGFRHTSLTTIPQQTYDNGKFGDTTGLDFVEEDPRIIVRVGSSPGKGGREDSQLRSAYSSDQGKSWQSFMNPPTGAVNGKVAVSAKLQRNGYPIIVWAPQGDIYPHRSLDGGNTWLPVQGAPNQTTLQLWFSSQAIASDRVDGNLFYLYKNGEIYRSTDGGATWLKTAKDLPSHWFHSLKAAPEMRGEVWLTVNGSAPYRSSDAGVSFTKIANIQTADNLTFGKAAPGRQNPTVFINGTINNREGLFRSDDATSLKGDASQAKWVEISTKQQVLSNVTYLEGDRLTFGKIYVGTSGRGILYGQPMAK
jgi:xyloglucan-specific exo-beta-1,4-glucanase